MNRAALYLVTATLCFAVINVSVKSLGRIPASEIVLVRALITLCLCYVFLWRKGMSVLGTNRRLLVLRGVFGTLSLFSFFVCLQRVPLAVAMTLINLSPLFTVAIAHIALAEKARWSQWVLLLFCFVGVALVRGEVKPVPLPWMGLGVFAALCAGIAYTCVRALRTTEDPLVVMFYFPLITLPLLTPVVGIEWVTPHGSEWVLLILIGIMTQVAQYFMTVAYQLETAAKVMIFNYLGVFWGVILGWVVFAEALSARQISGVVIVFLCLSLNYWLSRLGPLGQIRQNKSQCTN